MNELQKQIANTTDANKCFDLIYQAYNKAYYSEETDLTDLSDIIVTGLQKNPNKDTVLLTLLKIHTDEDLADPLRDWDTSFDIKFFQKINKSQEKLVEDFCDELLYDSFIDYQKASKDRRRMIRNNLTHLKLTIENTLEFENKKNEENFNNFYLQKIKELYNLCIFVDNVEYEKNKNEKDTK